MTAWLLGGIAAWATLRILGADRSWPWRVGDLERTPHSARRRGDRERTRPRRTDARRAVAITRDRQRHQHRRRQRRRRGGPISSSTASAVDLLNVAVTAGHGLHRAIGVVGESGRGALATEFAAVTARVERGSELRSELMRLPEALGDEVRPLVVTLCAALGSGAPLAPQLVRLADGERLRERRRREERARRLPVVLLGPLVGLILPAFVLLSVVPVALNTVDGISGSAVLPAIVVHTNPIPLGFPHPHHLWSSP